MIEHAHYRVNIPKVINETIDGETVIVNLDTGNYYSLDKIGAEIWSLMERNASMSGITEHIVNRYNGEREEIEKAIKQLMDELQKEALIVTDESRGSGNEANPGTQDGIEQIKERHSFEAPVLHKYTDMQDLLLLDPIHEVDDTGWPNVKSDTV
jgi:hypothetical protein